MDKSKNALLWELSPSAGGKSSFLFGTIHLTDRDLFFRLDEAFDCLDRCEVFMAEYPLDEENPEMQASFTLPDPGGLLAILPRKTYKKLRKQILKSFGFDILQANHVKPMILEQFIASSTIVKTAEIPMDMVLWDYAKLQGKILEGAESLDSQIHIMQHFPMDMQIKQLLELSRRPERYRGQLRKLRQYYLDEQIAALYRKSVSTLGKMKRPMVYDRNEVIANRILELGVSSGNSVFCAVGAGHLYGSRGLLRLLKQNGFNLIPRKHSG